MCEKIRLCFLISLFATLGFLSCGGSDAPEPEQRPEIKETSWYNSSVFKPVLGDFEGAQLIEVEDPTERAKLVQEGKYLVTVSGCGRCHGGKDEEVFSTLAGGQKLTDRFGEVYAANLTPDETGLAGWTSGDIIRAIRSNIDKDGKPLSLDVHRGYRQMANKDALAISVFLQSIPKVDNPVERRALGALERRKYGLFSQHSELKGYIPEIKGERRGEYLANHVLGCQYCHSPATYNKIEEAYTGKREGLLSALVDLVSPDDGQIDQGLENWQGVLSKESQEMFNVPVTKVEDDGEPTESPELKSGVELKIPAEIVAPNIRGASQAGLASWTEEDLFSYLADGMKPGAEEPRADAVCPWPHYAYLSKADRNSVAGYIKSLK